MELLQLVSYHLTNMQCMPHMVLIVLELAVLEVLYVTIVEVETLCIGDRRLIWLDKVEEISSCHRFIIVLRRILSGGQ